MIEACVGFLEFHSIARGIEATDALLKKAPVQIAFSHPVSSGKYLTMFHGEVEAVQSSLAIGREVAGTALLDYFFLANLRPEILEIFYQSASPEQLNALGIVETKTCASCIEAADIALKTTQVQLLKIELARGIGGKAYFIVDGNVADVEASLLEAGTLIRKKSALVEKVVIAQATPDLLAIFASR